MTEHTITSISLVIYELIKCLIVMVTFHRQLLQLYKCTTADEIKISGGARTNAFDNNFITFDSTTETFDETVLTTLMSDTGIYL